MIQSEDQAKDYQDKGFLFVPSQLSAKELAQVSESVPLLLNDEEDGMHREWERAGAIRQVYLARRHNPAFQNLIRKRGLLDPVKRILRNNVYVYHSELSVFPIDT